MAVRLICNQTFAMTNSLKNLCRKSKLSSCKVIVAKYSEIEMMIYFVKQRTSLPIPCRPPKDMRPVIPHWQVRLLRTAPPWHPGARKIQSQQNSVYPESQICLHSSLCVLLLVVQELALLTLVHISEYGVGRQYFCMKMGRKDFVHTKMKSYF